LISHLLFFCPPFFFLSFHMVVVGVQGHTANILDFARSGDGRLVTCGEDAQSYVFQLDPACF
jgi:hypothetical protein